MRSLNTTAFWTEEEQALGSFTRCKLKRLSNWNNWLLAEAKQPPWQNKECMAPPSIHLPAPSSYDSTGTTPLSPMEQGRHAIVVMVPLAQLRLWSLPTRTPRASNSLAWHEDDFRSVRAQRILLHQTWRNQCLRQLAAAWLTNLRPRWSSIRQSVPSSIIRKCYMVR